MSARQRAHRTPTYRRQKATPHDRAFVELNGRRVCLGRYGTPESRARYDQVVAEWLANGRQRHIHPDDLLVCELTARFWEHAESYYVKADGSPTTSLDNFRQALRPLNELYSSTPVSDLGPKALRAVRQRMVEAGWSRTHINKQIRQIRHVFKWAVERELVAPSVYQGLQAVAALKRGRTDARETEPVKPVPDQHIDAVKPYVSRQVWALIQLQLLTAARPGELIVMRPIDLDMTGGIWLCRPEDHKTAHHGHERVVYFGPRAQGVINPFLNRPLNTHLFSPVEAEAERHARLHDKRQTPMSCGNLPGSNQKHRPESHVGDHYSVASYRRAIERACTSANVPKWSPHRLRHSAGTHVRREFGLEAAQLMLGHARADVTQVYAEVNHAKALDVAAKIG